MESAAGTVFAFVTSIVVGQWIIYPLSGIKVSMAANIHATIWFTAVSLVRSYWLRRFFNWIHHK